ncbi:hypothetical protein FQN54_002984 [Arachnomyces sp. PD_36]|nr:hypothetical protein FQN54_002984 [Arachnomyces sp. PD_36]
MHRANRSSAGRAASSNNWRMKHEEPQAGQSNNGSQDPRTREPAPASIAEGRRLYVGNLLYMAKLDDIKKLFEGDEYRVERIDMSVDPFTGRNPSYCFVELENKEQAQKAMRELDGKRILGRPVKIKPGVPKLHGNQSSGSSTTPMHDDEGTPRYAFDRWERTDAADHWTNYTKGQRLYVGGLPRVSNQLLVNHEIIKIFDGFTVEAISKMISPTTPSRPKFGYGYYLFVDFPSVEEATAAMKAVDGKESPWGGTLMVDKSTNFSRKVEEREFWIRENSGTEGKSNSRKSDLQSWRRPAELF